MSSRALDVVTIFKCLEEIETVIGSSHWNLVNDAQRDLWEFWNKFKYLLKNVVDVKTKSSKSYQELNSFLVENGFDPMFQEFDPASSFGVASILDKMVKWFKALGLCNIITPHGNKPGFKFPESYVNILQVEGYPSSYLITPYVDDTSRDAIWFFSHPNHNLIGLNMISLICDVANKYSHGQFKVLSQYSGLNMPMIDLNIEPNLDWLLGAVCQKAMNSFVVEQAFQQFKFRMNETGARAQVATGMAMKSFSLAPRYPFIMDKPFYCWFTQKDKWMERLPIAAFYADYDCWKRPENLK